MKAEMIQMFNALQESIVYKSDDILVKSVKCPLTSSVMILTTEQLFVIEKQELNPFITALNELMEEVNR